MSCVDGDVPMPFVAVSVTLNVPPLAKVWFGLVAVPVPSPKFRASLVGDPGVVAVVGHYLPETTAAAAPIYAGGGLALLPAGAPPFT